MKNYIVGCVWVLILVGRSFGGATVEPELNRPEIHHAATNANSLFLNPTERSSAVNTFVEIVQIKGINGQEQTIREKVKQILKGSGAIELLSKENLSNAPFNLVMELPAVGKFTNDPGILFNAHLDTVPWSTPEHLRFDSATGDFFHKDEATPAKSSFGGDDRSGVIAIVAAMRTLHADYWTRGIPHRRIVLVFTADEERGCVGAKYLARHQPELFNKLDITLSMDGPLELHSNYPKDSLVAVVAEKDAMTDPYRRVLSLMQDFCNRSKMSFGRTEVGLGMGDFAYFPAVARAGLHLRSPVRGWHSRERVKIQDLINHIDLICFLTLGWDHPLPSKISPETLPVRIKD